MVFFYDTSHEHNKTLVNASGNWEMRWRVLSELHCLDCLHDCICQAADVQDSELQQPGGPVRVWAPHKMAWFQFSCQIMIIESFVLTQNHQNQTRQSLDKPSTTLDVSISYAVAWWDTWPLCVLWLDAKNILHVLLVLSQCASHSPKSFVCFRTYWISLIWAPLLLLHNLISSFLAHSSVLFFLSCILSSVILLSILSSFRTIPIHHFLSFSPILISFLPSVPLSLVFLLCSQGRR